MTRLFLFVLGIFLCSFGLSIFILDIGLLNMGYSFFDFVKFIIRRSEIYLIVIGVLLIRLSLKRRKK